MLVNEGKRKDKESGALFLNAYGGAMQDYTLGKVVRKYVRDSGIDKEGGCHLFRHSMATLSTKKRRKHPCISAVHYLLSWKNSQNRKPILLRGARQVGKSYLAKLELQHCKCLRG